MDYAYTWIINNKGIDTEDDYPYTAMVGAGSGRAVGPNWGPCAQLLGQLGAAGQVGRAGPSFSCSAPAPRPLAPIKTQDGQCDAGKKKRRVVTIDSYEDVPENDEVGRGAPIGRGFHGLAEGWRAVPGPLTSPGRAALLLNTAPSTDQPHRLLHLLACPARQVALKKAAAHQPVAVAIEADAKSFQLYGGGVYDDET
jgi:hypothetical protein